ncbi:hypothetical protein [Streptomyces sp. UNOC14_S4]|uniref:hypothetical protein n=1 Tax=Streptomyces sp. UNOC14_S4 TaxID=2872340 RepID=UPI001E4E962F|nr:hypothetical protein [Streptomyces sp. UNOC14_S4]MCC3767113.1 hypothetical protein [Streptomyces sp. UNOC14_S4]
MQQHRQEQPGMGSGAPVDRASGRFPSEAFDVGPYTVVEKRTGPSKGEDEPRGDSARRHLTWVGGAVYAGVVPPGVPEWVPDLGDIAVDASSGAPVAGEVCGWDGEELILCVPGEETRRNTTLFRRATVQEELSVKNAFANRRRRP